MVAGAPGVVLVPTVSVPAPALALAASLGTAVAQVKPGEASLMGAPMSAAYDGVLPHPSQAAECVAPSLAPMAAAAPGLSRSALTRFSLGAHRGGIEILKRRPLPAKKLWSRLAPLVLLVLAALTSSCAMLPGYSGLPPRALGPDAPPAIALHDYRGVIHNHSNLSYDSPGTPQDIIKQANRDGLDFIIMTDHPSERSVPDAIYGMRGKTLFMAGAELEMPKKNGGSLLVLGVHQTVDLNGTQSDIIRRVHEQGGLVFIGHLEEHGADLETYPFDGFEIYNMHAAAKQANPVEMIARALFLPPAGLFAALRPWPGNFKVWDDWLERRPVPIIGGNDAHNNIRIFGPLGGTAAPYEQVFHHMTTHVWAKSLDESEILSALRDGRSYVSFDHLGDATGFSVMPVKTASGTNWRIYSPEMAHIEMLRRGKVVAQKDGQWLDVPILEQGKPYRVTVSLGGKLWIIAGPFVSPSAAASLSINTDNNTR